MAGGRSGAPRSQPRASLKEFRLPAQAEETGARLARALGRDKAIMGIFDEGCMGMYNAIIPDELLHSTGVFKERLSQSALFAEMRQVSDEEALAVRKWLDRKGMSFVTGPNPETDLTDGQILSQCKMYIAALRIADDFGCDTIGIQYQQGLKDLAPASDLAEGLLNNVDRPPATARHSGRVLYEGRALPHFNEVDECAGLDALATNRIWTELGYDPECTLHDVRYGERFRVNGVPSGPGEFVWVFEISGAVPPAHLMGGYAGAVSERQPPCTSVWAAAASRACASRARWSGAGFSWRAAEGGPGARPGHCAPARGDRAALAHHDAAVAHDARGARRHYARPVHGAAQGQPRAGGIRSRCAGGRPGAGDQGGHVPRDGNRGFHLRDVRG